MNILQALFKTSIGKKVVMAITGLILFGFVIGHLIGNLHVFSPPEEINAYAHFLQGLGVFLWAIRLFLLTVLVLHVWTAISLVIENKAARGSQGYANQRTLKASYASRTMKYSGLIVLAFIIYHILHFTTKTAYGPELYMAEVHGQMVPDVHTMMVLGFQQPLVSVFYLISIALLSWHLQHGIASLFQSLGLRSRSWNKALECGATAFAILYFLGNATIVVSALTGVLKVQNEHVLEQLANADHAAVVNHVNPEK